MIVSLDTRIKSWYVTLYVSAFLWLIGYRMGGEMLLDVFAIIMNSTLLFTNVFFVFFSKSYKRYRPWSILLFCFWLLNMAQVNQLLAIFFSTVQALLTTLNLKHIAKADIEDWNVSPMRFAYLHSPAYAVVLTFLGSVISIFWLFIN